MISIREQSYGLNVALYNEFTIEDFRELEQAVLKAVERVHRPDLLLDLSRLKDFGRIAIVVDDIWIKFASHISDLLTRTHPKYFDTAAEAQAWLLGE